MDNEQKAFDRARKRVDEIKGFYGHLIVFIFVNLGLFLLNWLSLGEGGTWWFYWPLLGWGIGLTAHFLSVFGFGLFLGKDWEKRKVEQYAQKFREENDRAGRTR